ncbi:MAG: permease-like cell division protein FtsX [candidate division WOR-3 bacterium]
MNLVFIIKETIKGLKVNFKMGIVSLLITSFSLFVFFLFFILTLNGISVIKNVSSKIEMDVYLKKDVNENIKKVFYEIVKNFAGIKEIKVIKPEEAKIEFSKMFPEYSSLLNIFEEEILPERIVLILKPNFLTFSYKSLKKNIEKFEIVDEVIFGEEWLLPFSKFIIFLIFVDIFLLILLFFLFGIVMVQTLRLTILRRKEVIKLLEIIGATEKVIKGPFILEGIFYGFTGGFLSGLFLFLFCIFIDKYFKINLFFKEVSFFLPFASGTLLGFISSLVAISKREI